LASPFLGNAGVGLSTAGVGPAADLTYELTRKT